MCDLRIQCPGCKEELEQKQMSAEFKMGQDNSTISIYVEVYCFTCNAPAYFTFVQLDDMVCLAGDELNSKEVSNG
jgi:hypothetical protein